MMRRCLEQCSQVMRSSKYKCKMGMVDTGRLLLDHDYAACGDLTYTLIDIRVSSKVSWLW